MIKSLVSLLFDKVLGQLSRGPGSLTVGILTENMIHYQGMVMTASYVYKAYESPAVVPSSLSATQEHADTRRFVSGMTTFGLQVLFL